MPISSKENKKPVMDLLKKLNCKNILELGVGYGHFGPKIRIEIPGSKLIGIEIYKPYFEKIPTNCYNGLYNEDMRTFDYDKLCSEIKFDAVMLIDSLEHIDRQDGFDLLQKLFKLFPLVIVSVPIIDYPQGEFMGNAWEEHKTQWKINELVQLGFMSYFIEEVIGVFYKLRVKEIID